MKISCEVEWRDLPSGALELTLSSRSMNKRAAQIVVIQDSQESLAIKKGLEHFSLSKMGF